MKKHLKDKIWANVDRLAADLKEFSLTFYMKNSSV
jgi:hypothetical protein